MHSKKSQTHGFRNTSWTFLSIRGYRKSLTRTELQPPVDIEVFVYKQPFIVSIYFLQLFSKAVKMRTFHENRISNELGNNIAI